ncbi:MAG: 2-amino-4-hydroxy-6-hydroxymethyldihydropteridine diphosphokinase [Pirellulaceae bacterium]|nr:2-amino-4-hydroxy-6-hydroxymethyldihydropteridine diphosphokinase [Planctomycetales bacterium]
MTHSVYLLLGSNIQPERNLERAVRHLVEYCAVRGISRVWQSPPFGYPDQADFLNVAVHIETNLTVIELRDRLLRPLEQQLSRVRDPQNKNGPRTIDIDIAIYGDLTLRLTNEHLSIPDPDICERLFICAPLAELAPGFRHPVTGQTLADMAEQLSKSSPPLLARDDVDLRAIFNLPPDLPPDLPPSLLPGQRQSLLSSAEQVVRREDLFEFHFFYGHRLLRYAGKCRHLHGHNGRVQIEVVGSAGKLAGRLQQVHTWVCENWRGRMILCHDDPAIGYLRDHGEPIFLLDANPTTENLARWLFHQCHRQGVPAATVRMWESPRSWASYTD